MNILIIGDDPGFNLPEGAEVTHTEGPPGEGKFDQVYLTGVLETIPREGVMDYLKGIGALLGELGELHIRVPSLEWACREIAVADQPKAAAFRWLYGTAERPHNSGFTVLWLRMALLGAGYMVRKVTQLVVKIGDEDARENYAIAIRGSDEAGA